MRKPISFENINKRLFVATLALLVLFFASQFLATSVVGTRSIEIEQIRLEADELRKQNSIVSSQIDELNSGHNLKEIAETYNLVEKKVTRLDPEGQSSLASNN